MRVLGAGAKLGAAYSAHVDPCHRFTGAPLFEGLMAIDYALAAAREALAMAELSTQEIDLIISASISPDHLSDQANIMGPRLCHPLQRELGASGAVVFDLHDACWVFALDVAQSFLREMGLDHALVVRADCLDGMDRRAAGGLGWEAGAGAVVLHGNNKPGWRAEYRDLEGIGAPAHVELLDARRRFLGRHRAALVFSAQPQLASAVTRESDVLLRLLGAPLSPLVEPWRLNGESAGDPQVAPYALPMALSRGANGALPTACVSFDPFRLRVGACPLELS